MAGILRTVVGNAEEYQRACEQLSLTAKRLDEVLNEVTRQLHLDAELGIHPLPERNVWFRVTDPFPDAPPLRIWYSIQSDEVELLYIELVPEDQG